MMSNDPFERRLRQLAGEIASVAPEAPDHEDQAEPDRTAGVISKWSRVALVAAATILLAGGGLALAQRFENDPTQTVDVGQVATSPTPTPEPQTPEPTVAPSPGEPDAATPTDVSLGKGPSMVVGPNGQVLYEAGQPLPTKLEPWVAAQIDAELLRMPALGETMSQRRQAIDDGGLTIRVSLNPWAQEAAQTAFADLPADLDAAAVTIDNRTGDIIGAESRSGVTVGLAQPAGSARLAIYAAALEIGLSLDTLVDGTGPCTIETDAGSVEVANFGGSAGDTLSLQDQALRASRCGDARLEVAAGEARVNELVRVMTGAEADGVAAGAPALTAQQHAAMLVSIANGGELPSVGFVSQVVAEAGEILFERSAVESAVSRDAAVELMEFLRANVVRGTGTRAQVEGLSVAGITGTDEDFRVAWFVGTADGLTTALWVALPGNSPMVGIAGLNVTGGSFPAEAWARLHGTLAQRPLTLRPAVPLSPSECPPAFPVGVDTNADGDADTCIDPGDGRARPAADYETTIEPAAEMGESAANRYAEFGPGERPDIRPGSIVFLGTARSTTGANELFRWHQLGTNVPVTLGPCLGSFSDGSGVAQCGSLDRPSTGPRFSSIQDDEIGEDSTQTLLLSNAPRNAVWFVVDTDTGRRVVANIVGGASLATWPSEGGAPQRLAVLRADHIELWSQELD